MSVSECPPAVYTRGAIEILKCEFGLEFRPQTLTRWAHEGAQPGKLPPPAYFKDGHRRLYPVAELREWARKRLGELAGTTAAHAVAREQEARHAA